MSDGGETRVYDQASSDALDDEAPPEIPDIASDPHASPIEDGTNIPIDVDPEPLSDATPLSSNFRRLSPPPKPRRRERSITAPQTPTSRSFPPAMSDDESLSKALKAPLIPSLATETKDAPGFNADLARTQPSLAPPVSPEIRESPIDVVIQTAPAAAVPSDKPPAPVAKTSAAEPGKAAAKTAENGAPSGRELFGQSPPKSEALGSSAPAILAMRIITVGDASRAPAAKASESAGPKTEAAPPPTVAEPLSAGGDSKQSAESSVLLPPSMVTTLVDPEAAPAATPAAHSAPLNIDVAEEIADADVAPDSEDGRQMVPAPVAAPSVSDPPPKAPAPPPPPRRQMNSAPSRDELSPPAKAKEEPKPLVDEAAAQRAREEASRGGDETQRVKIQRRAWWEELFNEDFVRATTRLSDDQVRREVDFIEESLGVAAGGVVLDLGCGAGYHAVELATRGYGVVGYDLSLYQLALAADVAQEQGQRINFLQGDMREMAFEEMFDGIYCWNTSFGYFDEEKNIAVAQRIFRALRPGGMFLLDVVNRDFVAAHQPSQVWYEGDSCVCMDDMTLDFITSRLKVKRSIILDDGRTRESSYSLRLYALHELGKVLHDVGFRVTEASGHPSTPGIFFGQSSPRIIILAQRP